MKKNTLDDVANECIKQLNKRNAGLMINHNDTNCCSYFTTEDRCTYLQHNNPVTWKVGNETYFNYGCGYNFKKVKK